MVLVIVMEAYLMTTEVDVRVVHGAVKVDTVVELGAVTVLFNVVVEEVVTVFMAVLVAVTWKRVSVLDEKQKFQWSLSMP